MSIVDLFETHAHRNNVAHFAAIVNIAIADGDLNEKEQQIISHYRKKLEITDYEYDTVLANPEKYPIVAQSNLEDRLERIYDLLRTINSDNEIDDMEQKLILKYAISLGTPSEKAEELIQKSIRIFNGDFTFDEYQSLLKILE